MELRIYNTMSRKLEEFSAIDPDRIRMYTCGPTVYKDVHIGNFRTYLTSDLLRRTLEFQDFPVVHVMNITDVGHMRVSKQHGRIIDPIIEEANLQGMKPEEIASHYTSHFLADMKKIHMKQPEHMPRATEYIPEMIAMTSDLLKKGFAYEREGNVYFNVRKFSEYGKLSGNTLDNMDQLLEAVRVSVETDKKDSIDFALWKKADDGRAMVWDSPWGNGYPGWHIECSAMSQKLLGSHFDVHAGGEDLIFPHHENEIAQSECASGNRFVNYWIHTSYLTVDGEKMSRSKGNIYTISDLAKKKFSALAFRYLTYQTHYRMHMNFSWKALDAAQTALDKLLKIAAELPQPEGACDKYENEFLDALNQDLNMPKALSVMWSMIRSQKYKPSQKASSLAKMDEVLGFQLFETASFMQKVPAHVQRLLAERNKLRREKRFHLADQVRVKIEKMGFVVEDKKGGSRVFRKID